jgi:hypothetical protein
MAGKLVGRNKKRPEGRMNKGYLAETKSYGSKPTEVL